jgi:hypothetical protein
MLFHRNSRPQDDSSESSDSITYWREPLANRYLVRWPGAARDLRDRRNREHPSVLAADELPAALMNQPVMAMADQDQVDGCSGTESVVRIPPGN